MNFFAILFWIFSYASGRNGTKRNDNFYFPSLSLFQPVLAWNDAIMVFFNFLNFVAIFLEFSITHRFGTERNDNFNFSLFLGLFHPILASKEAIMVFFNFLNFSVIFLEFSITHRFGMERNDNFNLLSSSTFSTLFWLQKKP